MNSLAVKRHSIWILFVSVSILTVLLQFLASDGSINSIYEVFPYLGTLAWVSMWSQFVAGLFNKTGLIKIFHNEWIARISLFLILMHPGLFLVQRFLDTGLFPPESYLTYVGPSHAWAIVIAAAALASFLLYDVLKPFRHKLIAIGVWPFVSLLQSFAMIAIFIHSLTVGTSLNAPYFAIWWWALVIMLVPSLIVQVVDDFRTSFSRNR